MSYSAAAGLNGKSKQSRTVRRRVVRRLFRDLSFDLLSLLSVNLRFLRGKSGKKFTTASFVRYCLKISGIKADREALMRQGKSMWMLLV